MDGMDTLVENSTETSDVPKSRILVTFVSPGSVIFEVALENVAPMQLIALGEYLKHVGFREFERQQQVLQSQKEQNTIIVPELRKVRT